MHYAGFQIMIFRDATNGVLESCPVLADLKIFFLVIKLIFPIKLQAKQINKTEGVHCGQGGDYKQHEVGSVSCACHLATKPVTLHFDRGTNVKMASSNWPPSCLLGMERWRRRLLACLIRHIMQHHSTHVHRVPSTEKTLMSRADLVCALHGLPSPLLVVKEIDLKKIAMLFKAQL